jgi:hypothetical protein
MGVGVTGFSSLTYAPWVPREGMSRMFTHLCAAWGDPNHPRNGFGWSRGILLLVCKRGTPLPFVFDNHCPPMLDYETAFVAIRLNAEKPGG